MMPAATPHAEMVYFHLFDDCNVKCNMCGCWQQPRTRPDTEDAYLSTLEAVLGKPPRAIRFTGGEPLLLPQLPRLVRRAAEAGVRVTVITNGRLLASKAERLAASGCGEIVLSLDGLGPAHDRIRMAPGLFGKCVTGLDEVVRSGMAYGVNTVVQRLGVPTLQALADFLVERPVPPSWWHLIPVRDNPELVPADPQRTWLRSFVGELAHRTAARGIELVAEPDMFAHHSTAPCDVPGFVAYVRGLTGEAYGCNMLAYADGGIGTIGSESLGTVFTGPAADRLRARCGSGANRGCSRCDPASKNMNHVLRRRVDS